MKIAGNLLGGRAYNVLHCFPSGKLRLNAILCKENISNVFIESQQSLQKYPFISRAGLDPKVLLDVLNNSSARSWSTEVYCPVPGLVPTAPSSRNYDGGFKNELMVKVSEKQLMTHNLDDFCNIKHPMSNRLQAHHRLSMLFACAF